MGKAEEGGEKRKQAGREKRRSEGSGRRRLRKGMRAKVIKFKPIHILHRLAKNLEHLEDLMPVPKCAECGKTAEKKCSRCKNEW